MATLDELAAYLATELSMAVGTDLFSNRAPPTPDAVLTIYETGGSPSELGLGVAGVLYEFPSVQVVARGAKDDFVTPRTVAENAYRALAEIQGATLSGTEYLLVRPLNPPQSTAPGVDEDGRPRWSFNVLVEKELSA